MGRNPWLGTSTSTGTSTGPCTETSTGTGAAMHARLTKYLM